jgi:hypothetical protein
MKNNMIAISAKISTIIYGNKKRFWEYLFRLKEECQEILEKIHAYPMCTCKISWKKIFLNYVALEKAY